MDIKDLIKHIEDINNISHTDRKVTVGKKRIPIEYENDFIKVIKIETSNKWLDPQTKTKMTKQWSIIYSLKKQFAHLSGWINLVKSSIRIKNTPVRSNSNYTQYGIRIYDMKSEPNTEIITMVLDYIFNCEVVARGQNESINLNNDFCSCVNDEVNNQYINNQALKHIDSPKPAVKLTKKDEKLEYQRDSKISANALLLANYKCENNVYHETFLRRRNRLPYTEPHHLIPMSLQQKFLVSLDVEANIISLCSHCHNKLHYGIEIKEEITRLYKSRKARLEKVGIFISLDELLMYYNIEG